MCKITRADRPLWSTGRRGTFWSVGSRSDGSYQLDDVAKRGALDQDRVTSKQRRRGSTGSVGSKSNGPC